MASSLLTLLMAVAPAGAEPPATVSELVVALQPSCLPARRDDTAPPPQVVSTFPAEGAVVRPGVLVLRVTFDQPMTCSGGFADAPPLPTPCRIGPQELHLSPNRRTVRAVCRTAPGRAYAVRLGEGFPDTFTSVRGRALRIHDVKFSTSSEAPVRSLREALAQDPEFRPAESGLHP